MSAMGLVSILVLKIAGPAAMAEYHLAFTIAYTLYLISRSMGISLLAELINDRVRMNTYVADAIVHTMLPLVGGSVLVIILAPWIMGLFGPAYADNGTGLLRLLALSCLPWGFTTVYLAVARAQGRLAIIAIVQVAVLVMVVGLAAALLGSLGSLGVGIAWLAAHTISAFGILVFVAASEGPEAMLDSLLRIATAFAKLRSTIRQGFRHPHIGYQAADDIAVKTGIAEADRWQPLHQAVSQSDVLTTFLGDPAVSDKRTQAVLKTPLTQSGIASLELYLSRLQCLHADHRLSGIGIRFPEILLVERQGTLTHLYERMMPGEDGRVAVQMPRCRGQALRAAVSAITTLHDATCETVTIDDMWIKKWIDEPAGKLLRTLPALMTASSRSTAVASFRAEQYRFWSGRNEKLGLGHGDFWPGNILFSGCGEHSTQRDAASCHIKVEAIIDWDRLLTDAPAGLDASHLALTARALVSGDEIGQVVRRMLIEKQWSIEERDWLAPAAAVPADWISVPRAVRAMVGLAWLHHVTANLEKTVGYAKNRLWVAVNIDRVLQTYLKLPDPDERS